MTAGPTDAEIDAWAASVRQNRQAWLEGPTEEEKVEWARRERLRRMAGFGTDTESRYDFGGPDELTPSEARRQLERRYVRDIRLAAEGLGILMATWPFRVLAELVTTGQEWEDELNRPSRRSSIPFDNTR
jgi:hypothetical protein